MSETTADSRRMSRRSLDPVDLWANATPTPVTKEEQFSTAKRISPFWHSFSQLPVEGRAALMQKIVEEWPYDLERRAAMGPRFAMWGLSACSAGLVARPIMKEYLIQKKTPATFAVLSTSLMHFGLERLFVQNSLDTDSAVCAPCIALKRIAVSVTVGIVLPALAFPYFLASMAEHQNLYRLPAIKNVSDVVAFCVMGSKNVWRMKLIAPLLAAHVVFGVAATYCQLWARDRIIPTLEDDPELFRSLLAKVNDTSSSNNTGASIRLFLGSKPFLKKFVDEKYRIDD